MKGFAPMLPLNDLNDEATQTSTHLRAIEFLAGKSHTPVDQIGKIYQRELAQLKVGARVKDFLPILTIRKVRATFR
jgi:Protein of unknown function (DUF3562)